MIVATSDCNTEVRFEQLERCGIHVDDKILTTMLISMLSTTVLGLFVLNWL